MFNKKWATTQNAQNPYQMQTPVQNQTIQQQQTQFNNTNGLIKKNGCNCNKKKAF